MTLITDGTGTRWVEMPQRKRRASSRPLRFDAIKPGDQLVHTTTMYDGRQVSLYYAVTDIWFDPVRGERDPTKGRMIGIAQIKSNGELALPGKRSYPIRGLASQQFHYADIDYIAQSKARAEAQDAGKVVGIGFGRVIRKRPKMPGSGL